MSERSGDSSFWRELGELERRNTAALGVIVGGLIEGVTTTYLTVRSPDNALFHAAMFLSVGAMVGGAVDNHLLEARIEKMIHRAAGRALRGFHRDFRWLIEAAPADEVSSVLASLEQVEAFCGRDPKLRQNTLEALRHALKERAKD